MAKKKDSPAPGVAREVEQSGALCMAFANSAVPAHRRTAALGDGGPLAAAQRL